MTRTCITGGPRTGKTTLAEQMHQVADLWPSMHEQCGVPYHGPTAPVVRHTDNLIEQCKHLGKDAWSEASRIASTWLDESGPWIIEGVAVSRALRKWREAHPDRPPPVDRVIRLTAPHVALSKGQTAMTKGEEAVWQEIADWLFINGIPLQTPAELRCEHPGHNGMVTL